MPLTNAQTEFVKIALHHLLDFSTNPIEFSQEMIHLKEALTHPVEETHDYHQLRQCLLQPQRYLQRLETQQEFPITLGEVRREILELIQQQISKSLENMDEPSKMPNWSVYELSEEIIDAEDDDEYFTSERIAVDSGEHPHAIQEDGKIYRAYIEIDREYLNVLVDVHIEWDNYAIDKTGIFVDDLPAEHVDWSDLQEDRFMRQAMRRAKKKAEKISALCVIERLTDLKIITLEQAEDATDCRFCRPILCDECYLTMIKNREIDFNFLTNITKEEASNILDPTIKSLLKNRLCSYNTAMHFTENEKKIACLYYSSLKNHLIRLSDFSDITDEDVQILSCPPIKNLIALGKLTIPQALNLPIECQELFATNLYHFFVNNNIDWSVFETFTPENYDILSNVNMQSIIVKGIIPLEQIAKLSMSLTDKLCLESISSLLVARSITLQEVQEISFDMACLIEADKFIEIWIANRIIRLRELNVPNIAENYLLIYSRRLFSIYQQEAYTSTQTAENIRVIHSELPFIALSLALPEPTLIEMILNHLLDLLKVDFSNQARETNHSITKNHYLRLCRLIECEQKNNTNQKTILTFISEKIPKIKAKLTAEVLTNLKRKSSRHTHKNKSRFFNRQKGPNQHHDLQELHDRLMTLDLIQTILNESNFSLKMAHA